MMLDQVRRFQALGLRIIAIPPKTKKAQETWKKYQTLAPTEAEIHEWFGNGVRHNAAIITGAASEVVVVDADTPKAEAWCAANLPPTPMMTRSARGLHYYYRYLGDVPAFIRPLHGPAIEVKRDGQYVLAPGSIHPGDPRQNIPPGHVYAEVEPWPTSLDDLPVLPPSVFGHTVTQRQPAPPLPEVIGQNRNLTLTSEAGRLRRLGLAREEVGAALLAINKRRCEPPLPDNEVRHIAESVAKYPPGTAPADQRSIRLTLASEITPRPVRWLWKDRLALGTLALLAGREGIGKTTCAYSLAADITRGRLEGMSHGTPRMVIVAATEDSWEHTIVPRLMAADADLTRIGRVDVTTGDGESSLCLPKDIPALVQLVETTATALILLDPLMSRLDSKLDTHKDAEVRLALEPLVRLADVAGVVVLGIIHVNKGSSRDPLNMVMGSRAFTAVARAVLFVAEDPDNEEARVVGMAKNNLGRIDLPTLTFEIDDHLVAPTDDGDIRTGKLRWTGETDRSIREVVEDAGTSSETRTAKKEASAWLADYLQANKGVVESAVIKKDGAAAGHSLSSLKAARKELNITSQSAGYPRRTWWLLPGRTLDLCAMSETGVDEPTGPETRVEL